MWMRSLNGESDGKGKMKEKLRLAVFGQHKERIDLLTCPLAVTPPSWSKFLPVRHFCHPERSVVHFSGKIRVAELFILCRALVPIMTAALFLFFLSCTLRQSFLPLPFQHFFQFLNLFRPQPSRFLPQHFFLQIPPSAQPETIFRLIFRRNIQGSMHFLIYFHALCAMSGGKIAMFGQS